MKNNQTIEQLKEKSKEIRRHVVKMAFDGKTSHVGSALSCVDILTALYFKVLNVDPENWQGKECDRFILSKGHGAMAWYAALAERGFIPKDTLKTYAQNGSHLGEHPEAGLVPGIMVTTGSLGHGLSIGIGMAAAKRLEKNPSRVFVLLSDGECNEGSIWEAAMFAAHKKLDNLIVIVDDNHMQAMGKSRLINALDPLKEKWQAFGWAAKEIDGHDLNSLVHSLEDLPHKKGKPTAFIANTVLGKGVSFMEDDVLWHYQIPSEAQVAQAFKELS